MEYLIIENEKIGQIKAKLFPEKNPKTCKAIWDALPFDVSLSRWGEELYGDCPVKIEEENSQIECEVSQIALQVSGFFSGSNFYYLTTAILNVTPFSHPLPSACTLQK